uniref:SVP1-like protein 2 n=2 Tax=Hirondellea gigas TaxID=1518452 RepID=A0A6A7G414_9CRUS
MTTSHESARHTVHINNVSFNSDKSFFTVCMEEGLRVYRTDTLELYQSLSSRVCGSVGLSEQLDDSCAVVMTGASSRNKIAANEAMLYNFVTNQFGGCFKMPRNILNVLIRSDKLVLVTATEVQVYDVSLFPLDKAERGVSYSTTSNPLGLCQMSRDHAVRHVLCIPGSVVGSLSIMELSGDGGCRVMPGMRGLIKAHDGSLQCLRLSCDGRMIATASDKGTLIRLWCTQRYNKLMEFRRGSDPARIYDIDMSADNAFLAVVSDKKTAHVFAIKNSRLNTTSNGFSALALNSSYTDPLRRMSYFYLHGLVDCKIAIKPNGSVYVVTKDGRYYKHLLQRDGGEQVCRRLAYDVYSDLSLEFSNPDQSHTQQAPPATTTATGDGGLAADCLTGLDIVDDVYDAADDIILA